MGGDTVVFEIQQNSDVTFRLYDWDHVDAKTGQPRPLQIDQVLACVDFGESATGLETPFVESETPVLRERLFHCEHFWLWRLHGRAPFIAGSTNVPRVMVCVEGAGQIEYDGIGHTVGKGDVWLIPAEVGTCAFRPRDAVTLFEIALPE